MKTLEKKIEIDLLKEELLQEKKLGKRVVLCLGVFDLVHPGHIKHFQRAKEQGDILVVAVTANKFVNKGPDRPVFDQDLRMDSIAAIGDVDFVVLNNNPDGIKVIEELKPNYYVKGIEYKNIENDVTGKIKEEVDAIEGVGGEIIYTDDVVFSSSKLLNSFFGDRSTQFQHFIKSFKQKHNYSSIVDFVDRFKDLKVLVIGDAIIDQYAYVSPMGVSGKGTHLVAKENYSESFLGGAFAIANHIADFSSNVTLLTAVGSHPKDVNLDVGLNSNVQRQFVELLGIKTLIKKRYVQKDGVFLTKLFETYSSNEDLLNENHTQQIKQFLEKNKENYDLVVVADFGNGFINSKLNNAISEMSGFLAINTQINSGNRGYHVVTKYNRADYISVNEPELRLTAHDLESKLETLMQKVSSKLGCKNVSVTQGVEGVSIYDRQNGVKQVPALTQKVIDRVGAGDSYLALSALSLACGQEADVAAFLGSVAAALDVQIVGNKKCIEKIPFLKYITTLLK
ncbi:MAG: Bifunctional protein HldE [Chlamydiae bacterium]|nr:Bifunctional protein HldE [Chlamydiota bacterium]